jgi:hypothetical protein
LSNGNKTQVLGSNQVPLNVWSHLVITYNGSVITGYVNGQQISSISASGTIRNNNVLTCTFIGNEPEGCSIQSGAFPFPGLIDEVRVYNRALTDAEIKALYEATK